jgi:hypothetical protein
LASMLLASTAVAQPAPYNDLGVTMGHWHIASKDVEANKKLFHARRKSADHVPRDLHQSESRNRERKR